jgi:hypothetical protein
MNYTYKTKEELEQIWQKSAKILCKKTKPLYIEVLSAPTEVVTCCMDADGNLFEETSNAGEAGDVLVTQTIGKVIENDWVVYKNQYVISGEKYRELYANNQGFYVLFDKCDARMAKVFPLDSKTPVKTVVQLTENIVFEPSWGGEMKAIAGAYLVREDIGFYCINPVEFYATHEFAEVSQDYVSQFESAQ